MNKGTIIGGAIAIAVVALVAGAFLGPRIPFVASLTGGGTQQLAGPRGAGGPMAQLTEQERQQLQNMSESERQAFFQEKMGGSAPTDASGMPGGPGGRTMSVDGEITEVATDSVIIKTTDGGSRTVYTDGETTIGYAQGVEQKPLAAGDKVIVVATPEADNVITATAVLVK